MINELYFTPLMDECIRRNDTVKKYAGCDISLREHLAGIRATAKKNSAISFHKDASEVLNACEAYAQRLFGHDISYKVREALELKILNTADHHGGFYSAQAFQGDLLFAKLLEMMGYGGRVYPLFSFSHVELDNSTYARGISCYGSADGRQLLPLQRAKAGNQMVAVTGAYNEEMLMRMRQRIDSVIPPFEDTYKEKLGDIIAGIYGDKNILNASGYADQLSYIGERISAECFKDDDAMRLIYIEAEEVVRPLMIKDLNDKDSMLWHMFFDPKVREGLNAEKTDEDIPLAGMLLRGVDQKGRRIHTLVSGSERIEGIDHSGRLLEYPMDVKEIEKLLNEKKLIPSGLAAAVVLAFERGYTWSGGYFQSLYLPKWAKQCERIFKDAGLDTAAETLGAYDGSAFISGPVFALNETEDHSAVPAGPVEFMIRKPSVSRLDEFLETPLADSLRMGLFEMYIDLVPAGEKEEGWYRDAAEFCGMNYREHLI